MGLLLLFRPSEGAVVPPSSGPAIAKQGIYEVSIGKKGFYEPTIAKFGLHEPSVSKTSDIP